MTGTRSRVLARWCLGVMVGGWVVAEAGGLEQVAGWGSLEQEEKPWTRWWWLGSGVDEANLTRELAAFAEAGLGGVEICPIYGAKGYESRDLEFLSKEWMAALAHTTREAERLGLGVDLTTGTGWPFGGPWVSESMASRGLERVKAVVDEGKRFRREVKGEVVVLRAVAEDGGEVVDLAGEVIAGMVDWRAPEGGVWRVEGLLSRAGIQKVKRAAPGGAGWVLDPYSGEAIAGYLERFDEAFRGFDAPMPRAHFHDSFEYYGAEWSAGLLEAFGRQHGYGLLDQLSAFLGEGEAAARVRADWRACLSEMHRGYLSGWHDWAAGNGSLTRNQAHGSPGNLLDHYAVADIPETEIFRQVAKEQIPMMGLAASAAHLTGRRLVSAESFTWLGEHFQVEPAALKEAADFLYLGGVNHVFYHGVPYTPEDAGWPGWLFYASTHMGPNGGLWRNLPDFNGYLGRVQSVLQGGKPDSEVLLYFPFDDLIGNGADQLPLFTIHNQDEWLHGSGFHRAAMAMWERGIPHEAVSGMLLEGARAEAGSVVLGDVKARILVVPEAKLLPVAVAKRIRILAEAGVKVVFFGGLPEDVPGLGRLAGRRAAFRREMAALKPRVETGGELMAMLARAGVREEPMGRLGLRLVRRTRAGGHDYFVVNRSGERVDRAVALARPFESVVLMDPADEGRVGLAEVVEGQRVRLVLDPGESVVIRCLEEKVEGEGYDYRVPAGGPVTLDGAWKIEFVDGGPELPATIDGGGPGTWTIGGDPRLKAFSGQARYSLSFEIGAMPGEGVLLDLGTVATTCRASLNGRLLGLSFFPPHRFEVGKILKDGSNRLEVEVSNLVANRIADMDRRGVDWKRFHEINFVNIDYKAFDASGWETLKSGLIGPVKLVPVR